MLLYRLPALGLHKIVKISLQMLLGGESAAPCHTCIENHCPPVALVRAPKTIGSLLGKAVKLTLDTDDLLF